VNRLHCAGKTLCYFVIPIAIRIVRLCGKRFNRNGE